MANIIGGPDVDEYIVKGRVLAHDIRDKLKSHLHPEAVNVLCSLAEQVNEQRHYIQELAKLVDACTTAVGTVSTVLGAMGDNPALRALLQQGAREVQASININSEPVN